MIFFIQGVSDMLGQLQGRVLHRKTKKIVPMARIELFWGLIERLPLHASHVAPPTRK